MPREGPGQAGEEACGQAGEHRHIRASFLARPRRAARSTVSDRGKERFSVKGSATCSLVAQKQWCTVSTPTGPGGGSDAARGPQLGDLWSERPSVLCDVSNTALGRTKQEQRQGCPRSAYRRLRWLSSRRHSSEEGAQRGLVERRGQDESLLSRNPHTRGRTWISRWPGAAGSHEVLLTT